MPIYTFRNVDTGETEDKLMSMSQREPFLDSNPQLTQIHTKAPGLVSGTGDRTKTTAGFKEVLSKISESNPNSALANDYGRKDSKSVKTRAAIAKHLSGE
jgi:hypothetical protein